MSITTKYLFNVIGEEAENIPRLHASTIQRTKAYAIAIHIPVVLWAVTGYIIALKIFNLDEQTSKIISGFCAVMIYMVERIVISTPKVWFVSLGRFLIGTVIAIIGASSVDLVIFNKEITQQLMTAEKQRVASDFDRQILDQSAIVESAKRDWIIAQNAANCEANGTCGSGLKSVGPIYRQLAKHATTLQNDYTLVAKKLDQLKTQKALELAKDASYVTNRSGLLARVEALHEYTMENRAALIAWVLFFSLVWLFESMVVLSKLVFGETVDDRINALREEISEHKAKSFKGNITSNVAHANSLLNDVYGIHGKVM